jgi:ABC-type glycerol-3-phosphate transport system permease component
MVQARTLGDRLTDGALLLILILLALVCLLPFMHVISVSLSAEQPVSANQVGILPKGPHLQNYRVMMSDSGFINSFGVSVMRVAVGVTMNLLLMVITAYPLSRDHIHMPGRTVFKFFMLFGMMFSGGLIPYFLTLNALNLLNKFWVLVIPGALNIFSTIVVINYFRGIPMELYEAAVLDGANHLQVLFQVFIPVSTPVLATVTLFSAVGHWNSWFDGIIYLKQSAQWPLQSYLYSRITTRLLQWTESPDAARYFQEATPDGLATAMIIIATFPILLAYPLLQRYFIHGLTLGAVKE